MTPTVPIPHAQGVSHRKPVSVAFNDTEKQSVQQAARSKGVSVSTFLRMAALDYMRKTEK